VRIWEAITLRFWIKTPQLVVKPMISKDDDYPVLEGISPASFMAVSSSVLPSDLMGMFDVIRSGCFLLNPLEMNYQET
jgi:hypothetical protein